MIFYVYILLNPLKPGYFKYDNYIFEYEPFYVGKGKGSRKYSSTKDKRNYLKRNVINKIEKQNLNPIIITQVCNLCEKEAFEIEEKIINLIGRKNLNKGPLCNLTNGGEGTSGLVHSKKTKDKRNKSLLKYRPYFKSDEFKLTMKKSMEKRKASDNFLEYRNALSKKYTGEGNPMYNKHGSEKQKEAVKRAHKEGKIKLSEKGRNGIIEANKRRKGKKHSVIRKDVKYYELISPKGEIYHISGAIKLANFCKENKLQFHVLKNNKGIIFKELTTGNKIYAKNTIGWKVN